MTNDTDKLSGKWRTIWIKLFRVLRKIDSKIAANVSNKTSIVYQAIKKTTIVNKTFIIEDTKM